jgi:hypothetical protein
MGYSDLLPAIKVFRTRIRNSGDGGGVIYEPLIHRPLSFESWTAMVMGHIARAWYCGWVPTIGLELTREMTSPALFQRLRELLEANGVLAKVCEQAALSARELKDRSSRLRSDKVMGLRERDELRDLGCKLLELDALVARLGRAEPAFHAFANMSKVLMHNLQGANISDLGHESASCYRQILDGVNILSEWLKHTIGMAKPVAVQTVREREMTT